MSDGLMMVCKPVAMGPASVPGSDEVEAACGHPVWVSPVSRGLIQSQTRLICIPCAIGNQAVADTMREQGGPIMTAAQRKELNGVIGVAQVDQMIQELDVQLQELP